MDDFDRLIVYGLVVPLAIGVVLVVPAAWLARSSKGDGDGNGRGGWGGWGGWPLIVAIELAVLAPLFGLQGWPTAQWDWQYALLIPVVGFHVAAVTLAARPGVVGQLVAHLVLGVLVTGVLWRFVSPEPWPLRVIPGVGTFVLMAMLEPLALRRPGPAFVFAVGLATAGTALLMLSAGLAALTMGVVALGMPLLAYFAMGLWRRDVSLSGGPLALVVPVLVAGPFVAWRYVSAYGDDVAMPWLFFLPAAAPLLVWIGELPGLRRRGGGRAWIGLGLPIVLIVLACAASIVTTGALGDDGGVGDEVDLYLGE